MKKKVISVLLAGALALSFAGCSSNEAKEEATPETAAADENKGTDEDKAASDDKAADETSAVDGGVIGFSVSTQNNPFFVTLAEGVTSKASELGMEVVVVDAGDDTAKQTSDIEDLISRNVKVLIVNPVDSDAVSPVVQDAVDAGIAVISVDRAVNGVDIACQIASDNTAGGRLAGDYMAAQLGEKAKVAELEGIPGASSTIERGAGFHEAADAKLDVVAKQTANFNRAEGLDVTENVLQGNGDITGIFAHNDEMALGAVEAADASQKELCIVGFDATDDAITAIKEGRMAATVAQKPELMGQQAAETAHKILQNEQIESVIPVEVELITKDNAQ